MKIAFDAKRYYHNRSGLGNYSRNLVQLVKSDASNEVFLLDAKSKEAYSQKRGVYKLLPTFFWRSYGIWRNVKELNADVYHGLSNEIPFGKAPKGVKVVVTIHDLIFKHYPKHYKYLDRLIYNFKSRYAVKKADEIIAISPQTKKDIISFYNVDPSKIKIVYQEGSLDFTSSSEEDVLQAVKEKYNLPKDFYFYLSSFEERKNQQYLLDAFKGLEGAHLVLAGFKTNYYNSLEKSLNDPSVKGKVRCVFNATKEEIKALYELSSCFIYPSLIEGFGIPILDALNAGKTVYCQDNTNFVEMFEDACAYFSLKEVQSLRGLIDSGQRIESAKREQVLQKFSSENILKSMRQVYH